MKASRLLIAAISMTTSLAAPAFAVSGDNATTAKPAGTIAKWDRGPVVDGDGWEIRVTGRVQADHSIVDAETSGAEWRSTDLRRARLGIAGKYGDNLSYKLEINANTDGVIDFTDAFIDWAPGGGDWSLKLGQFKPPLSLDTETSARFISTLERAAFTSAIDSNRRLGVGVQFDGGKYSFFLGGFGDSVNQMKTEEVYALASRFVFTPVKTDERVYHFGLSTRLRKHGDDQGDFSYRQRPYARASGNILNTGAIARSDIYLNAEAAAMVGRWWAAGEYSKTFVNCSAAATSALRCIDDPTLSGGYAELGMFIGGRKTYKGGKFDRPKVDRPITKGGVGALSLVARYDGLDLAESGANGGAYDSYILGADWWPTNYTRLGVNFFKVDASLGAITSGVDPAFAALITGLQPEEDVKGAILRAQFDF